MAIGGLSQEVCTSQVLTGDGVVGTSGEDTVVYCVIAKGGSAITVADLTEGTDGTGTARVDMTAAINDSAVAVFPTGLFFDGGCHLDITTTGGSVTVVYQQ